MTHKVFAFIATAMIICLISVMAEHFYNAHMPEKEHIPKWLFTVVNFATGYLMYFIFFKPHKS